MVKSRTRARTTTEKPVDITSHLTCDLSIPYLFFLENNGCFCIFSGYWTYYKRLYSLSEKKPAAF
jgi:hypothetical protein